MHEKVRLVRCERYCGYLDQEKHVQPGKNGRRRMRWTLGLCDAVGGALTMRPTAVMTEPGEDGSGTLGMEQLLFGRLGNRRDVCV